MGTTLRLMACATSVFALGACGDGPDGAEATVDARVEATDGVLATWQAHEMSVALTNRGPDLWSGSVRVEVAYYGTDDFVWTPRMEVDDEGAWIETRGRALDHDRWEFRLANTVVSEGTSARVDARLAIDTGRVGRQRFTVIPYMDAKVGADDTFTVAGVDVTGVEPRRGCGMRSDDDDCDGSVTLTNLADTIASGLEICGQASHHPDGNDYVSVPDELEVRIGGSWSPLEAERLSEELTRWHPLPIENIGPGEALTLAFRVAINGAWRPVDGRYEEPGGSAYFRLSCEESGRYYTHGQVFYDDYLSNFGAYGDE